MPVGALAHHRDAVRRAGRERDGAEVELHPARLDLRQIEDLVDELEQMAPRVADVARRTPPGARSALRTSGRAARRRSRSRRSTASAARATCSPGTPTCAGSRPRAAASCSSSSRKTRALWMATVDWLASVSSRSTVVLRKRARTLAAHHQRTDDLLLASERHGDHRAPPVAAELLDVRIGRLELQIRRLPRLRPRSPRAR